MSSRVNIVNLVKNNESEGCSAEPWKHCIEQHEPVGYINQTGASKVVEDKQETSAGTDQ